MLSLPRPSSPFFSLFLSLSLSFYFSHPIISLSLYSSSTSFSIFPPLSLYFLSLFSLYLSLSLDTYGQSSNPTVAYPPPRTQTYRPLAKSPSDNGGPGTFREPSPVPPPPPPKPSLLQLRSRDSDRERDSPDTM